MNINEKLWARGILIAIGFFILLLIAAGLSGCTAAYHVKKAEKHAKKANFIQPGILTDIKDSTLHITITQDTVLDSAGNMLITHKYDSTYHYYTYQKYDFSEFKSWWETAQQGWTDRTAIRNEGKLNRIITKEAGKTDRKQVKQDGKTDRTAIRQDGRTDRKGSLWWLYILIGITFGLIGRVASRQLSAYFKGYINRN